VGATDESASPADFYAGPRYLALLVSKQRFSYPRGVGSKKCCDDHESKTLDHEIQTWRISERAFPAFAAGNNVGVE